MSGKGQPGNRFARAATQGSQPRPTIGQVRSIQRAEAYPLRAPQPALPNPNGHPPIDRNRPQPYEAKTRSLGLQPNQVRHFWQLEKGDAGAGSTIFRRASLFQQLAAPGGRSAATPYSKAIQIATERATDQRSRYFQVSLFSVGRVTESVAAEAPLPDDEILRFAPGIPQGVPVTGVTANVARGVPLVSTTKFRVMVFDESGQRFVDVDVIGTKTMQVYGFGVTVFALIKEEGYEIDRQRNDNEPLAGIVDQSVVGARIIPIRTNFTENPHNRTVTVSHPGGDPSSVVTVPIPPGSRKLQVYSIDGAVRFTEYLITMSTGDPLNIGASGAVGAQAIIEPRAPGLTASSIYNIANSNLVTFFNIQQNPGLFTVVFQETP